MHHGLMEQVIRTDHFFQRRQKKSNISPSKTSLVLLTEPLLFVHVERFTFVNREIRAGLSSNLVFYDVKRIRCVTSTGNSMFIFGVYKQIISLLHSLYLSRGMNILFL